jgi:hypothetical protein
MYRNLEYFYKLNYLLKRYYLNDLSISEIKLHKSRIDKNSEKYLLDKELIDACSKEVGINISNILKYNLLMLSNFRSEFTAVDNINLIQGSVYYILYCLMADKLLDDKGSLVKSKTCYYSWKNIKHFITGNKRALGDTLFDNTFKLIYENLKIAEVNKANRYYVNKIVKDSIVSEFFISNISLYDMNPSIPEKLIIDKSTRFVEASLIMTIMDLSPKIIEEAKLIAQAFSQLSAWADDLMDIYSDIENLSTNIVLYKTNINFIDQNSCCNAIDIIIDTEIMENCVKKIAENLEYIKTHCNKKLYVFSKSMLCDWFTDINNVLLLQ